MLNVADSKPYSGFAGSILRASLFLDRERKSRSNPGSRMGPVRRSRSTSLGDGRSLAHNDVIDFKPHSGFAGINPGRLSGAAIRSLVVARIELSRN
jgi:hypothetical protein